MAGERLKKGDVVTAIQQAKGYVSKAADLLGVTTQTIYNYSSKYPDVAEAIQESRESRHDYVESKLFSRIQKEDTTAIIFYLKTQAKQRGWVERQEVTGRDGGPMESASAQVVVYIPDNGRG